MTTLITAAKETIRLVDPGRRKGGGGGGGASSEAWNRVYMIPLKQGKFHKINRLFHL